jgi:hypothetical protein
MRTAALEGAALAATAVLGSPVMRTATLGLHAGLYPTR